MERNSVDGILNATSLVLNALFLVKRACKKIFLEDIVAIKFVVKRLQS
jgi:hypothetical protein